MQNSSPQVERDFASTVRENYGPETGDRILASLADAAQPAESGPSWDALLAAHDSAKQAASLLGKAHNAAENALHASKNERVMVAAPSALTITDSTPLALIIDGETRVCDDRVTILRTPKDIQRHCAGDRGAANELMAALSDWEGAQVSSDEETGYTAAVAAENDTNEVWIAALDVESDARHAVLSFPTADPSKIVQKRLVLNQHPNDDATVELGMIIDAVLAARPFERLRDAWGFESALADYRRLSAARIVCPDEESDEAMDVEAAAEMRLYRTPAPDLAGVLEKMRLNFSYASVDAGRTLEQSVHESMGGDAGDEVIVLVYRDLQRLAGVFDAAEWVEAYRLAGGDVSLTEGGLVHIGAERSDSPRFEAQQAMLLVQLDNDAAGGRRPQVRDYLRAAPLAIAAE